MQIKPADADRFLSRADPAIRIILIYGGDEGLVAERTTSFVKAVTAGADDPFAHVRLEASALSADPQLLADEAHAVAMFGGRRVISIRLSGNWQIMPALEPIVAAPPADAWIVIAAGDLRKTSPLRRLAETGRLAAAVPCYSDGAGDLDRIIDEEARAAGLTIGKDARAALRDLIGADRMQSRSEIAKLCLYADGAGEITLDAVRAVIGDASGFDADEAVDAVALSNPMEFAKAWRRLLAAGSPGFVIAGSAIRHFDFLHRARAAYDNGTRAGDIVNRVVPPIFFRRRDNVEQQIGLWTRARIERVLAMLERAIIDSRLNSGLSDEVIGQALLMAATLAAPRRAPAA